MATKSREEVFNYLDRHQWSTEAYLRLLDQGIITPDEIGSPHLERVMGHPIAQGPWGTSMSYGQHRSNMDRLQGIPGLSQEERNAFNAQLTENPLAFEDIVQRATEIGRQNTQQNVLNFLLQRSDADRAATLGNIDELRTKAEGLYGTELTRLGGFIDNPESIRGDAELSKRLTDVEASLRGQLRSSERGAAKTLASAGLRAAGKVTDPVQTARQAAVAAQGHNMNQVMTEIKGRYDTLGPQYQDYLTSLAGAEEAARRGSNVDLGGFATALGSMAPPSTSGTATNYDILGLGESTRQFDTGLLINALLGGASIAGNAGTQATQMLGGLFGKG